MYKSVTMYMSMSISIMLSLFITLYLNKLYIICYFLQNMNAPLTLTIIHALI